MKRFKKLISYFAATLLVAFLFLGCATTMKSLRVGADLDTIMRVVETIQPDEKGWRILSIPSKNFDTDGKEFVFFKKNSGNWGFGIVFKDKVILQFYVKEMNQWFLAKSGMQFPVSIEQAKVTEEAFMKILNEEADFAKAHRFVLGTLQQDS